MHNHVAAAKPDGPAHLVTAIANPEAFMQNAQDAGADIASHEFFPDHHEFTEDDAKRIEKQAQNNAIVTTAKDWVKLQRHVSPMRAWILVQRVLPEDNAQQLLHAIMALVS
jgi:tetraacyldisaccharide 4'-kinase